MTRLRKNPHEQAKKLLKPGQIMCGYVIGRWKGRARVAPLIVTNNYGQRESTLPFESVEYISTWYNGINVPFHAPGTSTR